MPALWETAAALSLPVFPLLPNKKPAIPKAVGGNGFYDASTDPDKIRDMFMRYRAATLIGVPTGLLSGYDVLDVDTARHQEAVAWLRSATIPDTRMHQTESGGRHYVFRHREGMGSWTGYPVIGIDGRGDGGYVCWWPAAGFATNGKRPADWPDDLIKTLARPKPKRRDTPDNLEPVNDAKLAGVLRRISFAANGERNDILFWGACRVTEWIDAGQVGRGVGERLLRHAADKAGLPTIEADKTINSAFTHRDRHS